MGHGVALERTSIIKVERISTLGITLAVTTRRHNTEGHIIQSHRRENHKSYKHKNPSTVWHSALHSLNSQQSVVKWENNCFIITRSSPFI
jgi:hypothetical protein